MTTRGALILLLFAALLGADQRQAHMTVRNAIVEYGSLLGVTGDGNIDSIQSRIQNNISQCSAKFAASVVRLINRGFGRKYKKSDHFHKCLAVMLAADTRTGIATLYRTYKSSRKHPILRRSCAEALADCGHRKAADTLLKIIHDSDPDAAAAAVKGLANYKYKAKKRKDVTRKMITRYMKVTDAAAGKKRDSAEMKMYTTLDAAMKTSLKAIAGEELDSALAYDAWWRDQKVWKD